MSIQAELRKIDAQKENPAAWTEMGLHRYPENLGSSEEPHYITFEINVREKTSLAKNNPSKIRYEIKRDSQVASNLDTSSTGTKVAGGVAAGAAALVATTGLARNVSKALNATGALSAKTKTIAALGGASTAGIVAAATASAVIFGDILESNKIFRITDHIALQVDGAPSVKYSMQYANKDLGALLGMLSGSAFENQSLMSGASSMAQAIGLQLAKLPGAFGAGDVAAAIGKGAGVALNPFREVIFEAVDFRSFQFKYKFLPKSEEETNSIRKILDLFKYHMHPELHESKLFFIYPSEFQITYWYKGENNPWLYKFRPVVLENMDVTYGGETFSSFKNGAPTEINLTLTFRETEIITKNLIDKQVA